MVGHDNNAAGRDVGRGCEKRGAVAGHPVWVRDNGDLEAKRRRGFASLSLDEFGTITDNDDGTFDTGGLDGAECAIEKGYTAQVRQWFGNTRLGGTDPRASTRSEHNGNGW
jgi:hypothetical protein